MSSRPITAPASTATALADSGSTRTAKPHGWVGTSPWAEMSGGALGARERRELWGLAARGELLRIARGFAARFDRTPLDLADIPMPDSALATAARELCARVSSPALLGHCLRTYLWGALLGQRLQQRFDPELMLVASLLHDLGLTEHAAPNARVPCFAVSGSHAALAFLLSHGVSEERAARAAECVTLHMNPYVPLQYGTEAQLMAAGAALDAIGSRQHELTPAIRAAVLARHPHQNFGIELVCAMRSQVTNFPSTRSAFIETNFGFLKRIARHTF
jgi:HD domain